MRKWGSIPILLFVGDVVVLYATLLISLVIRGQSVPSQESILLHVVPFTLVFGVWIIVWYIAGLYEKRIALLRHALPQVLIRSQVMNAGIAIIFFYLIPFFAITPKTLLFIYLVVSSIALYVWRLITFETVGARQPDNAIIIGAGREMEELYAEVNATNRFGIYFTDRVDVNEAHTVDVQTDIIDRARAGAFNTIVIDADHPNIQPLLPKLYNLIFDQVEFIDLHKVYEEVFDRVPLSLVQHNWFLENISVTRRFSYEFLKRLLDVCVSVPAFLVSLLVYPFVIVAMKLEGKGPIFFRQERVGENNKVIMITKFRSMTGVDSSDEALKSTLKVTKVGAFLRKSRIDELPQLWDVVRGDISLIGPRPEIPALVKEYADEIPFYSVRHLIKPGLSGWGQITDSDVPRGGVDVGRTARKLSYDLYYLKNRSFILDFTIVLKTIRILISRTGN